MKTSALTLQHHLTNCMRLFAVMLLLSYTYTATAQTTDTLKPAMPDKRWGIGVMVGTPDRTSLYNTNGSFESNLSGSYGEMNKISLNYGFSIHKKINQNALRLNFLNTKKYFKGVEINNFLSNGGGYDSIGIVSRFNIYNLSIGYELCIPLKKFEACALFGITSYLYSKGKSERFRNQRNSSNSPLIRQKEDIVYDGGYGIGILLSPSFYYNINKIISVGFNANLNFIYSKMGGYFSNNQINIDSGTSTVIQDKLISKDFFISSIFLFSVKTYFTKN